MNCPECRAIMEDGVVSKCTKCPRKWPMSIAEVKGDYPGYLMHEIIKERSIEDGVVSVGSNRGSSHHADGVGVEQAEAERLEE